MDRHAFTVVEVLVAIVIFAVGLLGLATGLVVSGRMVEQGRRAALAASLAKQRIEQLRANACTSRLAGSESFPPTGRPVVANTWTWRAADSVTHRIVLVTRYVVARNRTQTDSLVSVVMCPS
jgi:prepilin-type N-terminal cleavage/methylation domain-containing protein